MSCWKFALAGFHSATTRRASGSSWRMSSNSLPTTACDWSDVPVTLPPGRARLPTSPDATGSETPTITIGMVDVACFAAIEDYILSVDIAEIAHRLKECRFPGSGTRREKSDARRRAGALGGGAHRDAEQRNRADVHESPPIHHRTTSSTNGRSKKLLHLPAALEHPFQCTAFF